MGDFYLNTKQYGDNILYTGIRNGKKIRQKVPFKPSLYVPTNEDSPYKTLYGDPLKKLKFESIKKAKEFVSQFESVGNFHVYGNTQYEYCLISDMFQTDIEWDYNKIRIAIFDIEVNSDPETGGFASAQDTFQPITSIALKFVGEEKYYLFGYHDFDCPDNVYYIKCQDEWTLLKKFIEIWSLEYPDIVSGWNSSGFDIPYLINRCYRIIGEKETRKLSPWNIIHDRRTKKFNPKFNQYEEEVSYSVLGISSLDYLDLYKRYQPGGTSQESYKLDFIAEEEIGENKIEYDGSLHKLYTEDKQKFYEYNVKDVYLVEKLNEKCKLFELCLTLAYDSKTNYEDVFKQTRMWDALIYDYLKQKNIQIPQKEDREDVEYAGAYVKHPITGMHRWVATLDATSLYPSIIMAKNISIETLVSPEDYTDEMRRILSSGVSVDKLLSKSVDLSKLKDNNVTLTPNGQFFRTDKKGFLPEMVEKMFKARQDYKKKMLSAQKEYEVVSAELKKNNSSELKRRLSELQYDISKFNNLQNSKKLCLNSLYGATGNKHFRFFDVKMAEAITLEGQLSNRWVETSMNEYLNSVLKTKSDYVIYMDTDSCFGDSIIYVNGEKVKIEDYFDLVAQKTDSLYFDEFNQNFAYPSNDMTLSVSTTSKLVEEKQIKYVMKHKVKKRMFKIKIDNKEVIVTEDHSIMIERNGRIMSATPENIKTSDKLLYLES